MIILAIETSCDDTGIAIVEFSDNSCCILANIVNTQTIHNGYGGVFPMLAKREHIKNIQGVYEDAIKQAQEFKSTFKINAIAITVGPGLEPSLWVGIKFAQELAEKLGISIIPVNHMEGHLLSSLLPEYELNKKINFRDMPEDAISLLVSGGHTQLVQIKNKNEYKILGTTVDDAVGEAFDKVARMLGLPYPGGPAISKLAEVVRINADKNPQINTDKLLHKDLTYKIRGAFFEIYNTLGSGHKEIVYQNALAEELKKIGINFEKEKNIPVIYNNVKIGSYQPDFLIEGKIIIELKALPYIGHLEKKQLWHYLKNSKYELGFLVNFGSQKLQIERFIETKPSLNPSAFISDSNPRKSEPINFPRPMLHSKDYNFSYSGLKTAVLYYIQDLQKQNPECLDDINIKQQIAKEFEDAAIEVIIKKTVRAIHETNSTHLLLGGGVAANKHLQNELARVSRENNFTVYYPVKEITGDNALMIAIAGYFNQNAKYEIKAQGDLKL